MAFLKSNSGGSSFVDVFKQALSLSFLWVVYVVSAFPTFVIVQNEARSI